MAFPPLPSPIMAVDPSANLLADTHMYTSWALDSTISSMYPSPTQEGSNPNSSYMNGGSMARTEGMDIAVPSMAGANKAPTPKVTPRGAKDKCTACKEAKVSTNYNLGDS